MHVSLALILFYSSFSYAARLEDRQPYPCYPDTCLRALNGTRRGPDHPMTASSHCRNHLTTTVVFNPFLTTITVDTTSVVTVSPCVTIPTGTSSDLLHIQAPLPSDEAIEARQVGPSPIATTTAPIPTYATHQCQDEHYSSACRCLGIRPGRVTSTSIIVTEIETRTNTLTSIVSCSELVPPISTTGPATSTTYTITFSYGSTTSTTTVFISQSGYPIGTGTGTGTISHGYPTGTSSGTPYPSGSSFSYTSSCNTTSLSHLTSSLSSPYTNNSTSFSVTGTTASPPWSNSSTVLPPTDTTASPPYTTSSTMLSSTDATTSPPYTNSSSTFIPTNTSTTILPTNISTTSPSWTNSSTTLAPPDTGSTLSPTNSSTTISPTDTSSTSSSWTNSSTTLSPTDTTTFLPPTNTSSATTPPTSTPTGPLCGGRGVLFCNGTCIDTTTDTSHCGRCGNQCAPNFLCTNGVCTREACDSGCNFARRCGTSNETLTCACGLDTGNVGVCYNHLIDCGVTGAPRCRTTAQCAVGSVCVPDACCDGARCVRPNGCGDSGGLGILGERIRFGMEGTWVVNLGDDGLNQRF